MVDKKLKDIKFPYGVLISSIIRQGSVIIPNGNTELKGSDIVIVFCLQPSVKRPAFFLIGLDRENDEFHNNI